MKITRQQKKEKALEIMKTMDIYKPYITGFKDDDNVCFFETLAATGYSKNPKSRQK